MARTPRLRSAGPRHPPTPRPAWADARFAYQRHRSEETTLCRVVQEEFETFLGRVEAHTGAGLPQFVKLEEQGMTCLADTDADHPLASLQAASCTYRIALGPRAGQKVLSVRTVAGREEKPRKALCADAHGFSLHAAVRLANHQRKVLERLCRTITRPALANERLSRNGKGQVVLRLKSPYRDGTTHIVMEPQEFMQRLAALVPRPRLHLIRYHGVLAPNAKLRGAVVPAVVQPASEPAHGHTHGQAARMRWARLLKRVFDIHVERCSRGGQWKILAAIEEPVVIVGILTHLGLAARAPPCAAAREPLLDDAA